MSRLRALEARVVPLDCLISGFRENYYFHSRPVSVAQIEQMNRIRERREHANGILLPLVDPTVQ